MHGGTGAQSCILGNLGTMCASAITSHYGHLRLAIGNSHSEQVGYLSHHVSSAHGAVQAFKGTGIGTLDECISHTPTASKAAAATVGTGQQLAHLSNAGIFIDSKFLGGGKQHKGCYQAYGSKNDYCNQDKIHKSFFVYLF
jgi:hypothetical protein